VRSQDALVAMTLLAFLATRLTRTPMVFCSFDFLDYASLIRERGGRMDVNVIASHVPSRREAYMLRRVEHVFAISQRELAFFRRFNPQASYSPVPVLVDEYLLPSPSPRDRYGVGADEFVFLCLGRVSAIKGQDLALEAFIHERRGQFPEVPAVLIAHAVLPPAARGGARR
jgi:glycosyltransferase involved in cell wall biosynthesis